MRANPMIARLLAFAALPTWLGAQTPTDAELIARLGNDEHCLAAVRTLTHRGDRAVEALVEALPRLRAREDDRAYLMAIYALGKMDGGAAGAAGALIGQLRSATGMAERQLLWALGEIGPAAGVEGTRAILEFLDGYRPELGWNHQEWVIARFQLGIGTEPGRDELLQLLTAKDVASWTAAGWALRCGEGKLDDALRQALLDAYSRAVEQWRRFGTGYARSAFALARAVTARLPAEPEATGALVNLLAHFDPDVRLEAVMALGRAQAGTDSAIRGLIGALDDTMPDVRREAVTALGMIGPQAAAAVPALEARAAGDDEQLARRARVALAQIRVEKR